MTEEKEEGSSSGGIGHRTKGATENEVKFKQTTALLFPWFVHFSLIFCLVLAVVTFFQIQIVALQKELEYLKLNLSSCDEEKPRNVKKRSSAEFEEEVRHGAGACCNRRPQGRFISTEGTVTSRRIFQKRFISRARKDIQAAYLQGALPFQHIEKEGKIGPWSVSSTDDTFITLKEKNTEIEISQSGIYYVYAQVYYLTSHLHNSFQILSHNGTEERKRHNHLATCSSQGRPSIAEASCYTGFIGSFRSGQRLYLNQIEQNRIIHFTNGCSYFGVVLLKKNATLKRKP